MWDNGLSSGAIIRPGKAAWVSPGDMPQVGRVPLSQMTVYSRRPLALTASLHSRGP